MKISENLEVKFINNLYSNKICSFYDNRNSGCIECEKGSFSDLITYLRSSKDSPTVGHSFKTNWILVESKNEILDFVEVIEIIYQKDKKKFYANYPRIKKFETSLKNYLKYSKNLYEFLKGL